MFNKTLEQSLHCAYLQAKCKQHKFVTIEHLLLALLDNPEVNELLHHCGADLERLRHSLRLFLVDTTPLAEHPEEAILPTLSFIRVLQHAICQVHMTDGVEVSGKNVLLSIIEESQSQAASLLQAEQIRLENVVQHFGQEGLFFDVTPGSSQPLPSALREEDDSLGDPESCLERYGVILNKRAAAGKLEPVIGRDAELTRCMEVLTRCKKNNPLLVGEAGVGKTALVEGLAWCIHHGKAPERLAHATIYALDLGLLVAGTKYRGDFEKRLRAVLDACQQRSGMIVFIDEVHNIVGAGSTNSGSMDASNLLKPLLSSGEVQCLGATTYEEYRQHISKDHALSRRFQKVDVKELSLEETHQLLGRVKIRYEQHHQVQYSDAALEKIMTLASHYLCDRRFPDKAIDILDEAGASKRLRARHSRRLTITPKDIESVVANMAQIPVNQMTRGDSTVLRHLSRTLKTKVFDQDSAIDRIVDAIKLSHAGLKSVNKPMGSFLMVGPTGVGKTEIARQLSQSLGLNLVRIDMSEYMEKHAISRLIGSPPGYVGFEQGGLLTKQINTNPHCVLLLDEIEKAHPDIFNVLLQVMDDGFLTDSNGVKVDFRHVILLMTSNAGASAFEKPTIGFHEQGQQRGQEHLSALKQYFSPEFRNRLDGILQLSPLSQKTVAKIVDKYLLECHAHLEGRGVILQVNRAAKRWLVQHGYDQQLGARPLNRLIDEQVKKPLADALLYGPLKNRGGAVHVMVKANKISVKIAA